MGRKFAIRVADETGGPVRGELEVVATREIRRGETAVYAGVMGPSHGVADLLDLTPAEQVAHWPYLLTCGSADVLLPFVDSSNPVAYMNDPSRGFSRGAGPAANVAFRPGEPVVVALRDIAAGETIWVDYGPEFWTFLPGVDAVRELIQACGGVLPHLEAWAARLAALPPGASLPPSTVMRLRGEFGAARLRSLAKRDFSDAGGGRDSDSDGGGDDDARATKRCRDDRAGSHALRPTGRPHAAGGISI